MNRATAGALLAAPALALPRRARAQSLPRLRIGAAMADDLTPVYYALKTGMFQKAGIDVELTVFTSGAAIAGAVAGGALDVGHSSLITLLAAHTRGVPFVLVAAGALYTERAPSALLVQPADTDLKTGRDLNGKTIGVAALGDFTTLVVSLWVDQNGGDSKTLHFVEVPNVAEAAALEEHRVDAAAVLNPALTQALMTGKVKRLALVLSAIGPSYMLAAWFAMTDWAAQHADLVSVFRKVAADAAAFTNSHHDATAAMMSEATKIPLNVIDRMSRVDTATTLDPAKIQPLIDFAAKYKMISHAFPAREIIFAAT